nr:hypothetical protein [Pandoravirus aubagnensis]
MEAFALDPVDEMCARVRARWAAADRRRANAAWWCADTATVPRTPPHVLMNALAGEFDAYAAHRRSTETAAATVDAAPIVYAAAPTTRLRPKLTPPAKQLSLTSSAQKHRIWVAVAISAAAIALLIALVALALAPIVRAHVDDQTTDHNDDVSDSTGTVV